MISGLGFSNFQGFEFSQTVRLAPLTMIFGPNSSGKSSILRALRLLSQVNRNEPGIPLNGKHIEMGTFRSAVFNGDENRNFTLAVEIHEGQEGLPVRAWRHLFERRSLGRGIADGDRLPSSEQIVHGSKLRFEFEIDALGGGIPKSVRVAHDLAFRDRGSSGANEEDVSVELVFSRVSDEETRFSVSEISGLGRLLVRVPSRMLGFRRQVQNQPEPSPLSDEEWRELLEDKVFDLRWGIVPADIERDSLRNRSTSSETPEIEEFGEDSIAFSLSGFDRYLEVLRRAAPAINLSHVGPLRSISNTFQSLQQSSGLKEDASNLVSFLAGLSEDAMGQLSEWLGKLTNGRYTMVLTNAEIGGVLEDEDGWRDTGAILFQVGLKDHHTKTYVSPQNAGVGLSQILPILGSLALLGQERETAPRGSMRMSETSNQRLLLIEQPELHLHPRMQAEFAEVLVKAHRTMSSSAGRRETPQIIIETHSEALMMRMQKLIRQGRIAPSDLSVLFVDQFAGGGNLAQELRLDDDGNFRDTWPTSFGDVRWSEQLDD